MRFRLYRLLRWAEIDLPLYSLVHILRSHEDRDPRLHHAAGLCDYGGGSHVHVARQIENNNEVIAAKGVIERFEFAAHILGELFDHRSPFRAALLQQALQTLISVRTLHKIFRHSVSSFKLVSTGGSGALRHPEKASAIQHAPAGNVNSAAS